MVVHYTLDAHGHLTDTRPSAWRGHDSRAPCSQPAVCRDIKPSNVLVTNGDRLVITDFGIGLLDGAQRLTWHMFGDRLGTPDYMYPEQIQGKRCDPRSDVYALGCLLFEMLTGRVRHWLLAK